ncbi:hypothetical protein DPV78_008089 [Talaromyces pinophilus]|nr:hypothetical protein DPV78_008089 [Talaromyces pinophilus]
MEVASGGSKIRHTAHNGPPQPDEAQSSLPDQTQIDGHVPSKRYLKQSIRDEPWNSLHVQQKQTLAWWLYANCPRLMSVAKYG